ncbi:MAG: replicative DNA helicase [Oscillospiraceae bacterium]
MNFIEEQLPFSLEAEQSVLGGIILDSTVFATVLEYITKPDMFYKKQHREIFSVLIGMFNSSKNIDVVTVLDECKDIFDSVESAKMYIVSLMEFVPTVSNISEYCKIVQGKFYVRTLIMACNEISQRAIENDTDARALLDLAEQKIYDIRQGKDSSAMTKIDTAIIQAYDKLAKLAGEDKDQYLGVPTGFLALDNMICGLNKSDLILVAARPGMGKTSFALNVATNVAKKTKKDVAVFSLEMSTEQLVMRVLASEARIQSEQLKVGTLSPDDWIRLAEHADVLSKTNIYIDDTAMITVAEMKAKLRRLSNLGLVVIDYLQLMSSGRSTENRVQEISQMTRNLKILAKELEVPVILLSQLSRASEQRTDHKPMLSDLRDSGSIEQDADIVLFLYRESYYGNDKDDEDGKEENNNLAKILVSKNRHGSTGEVDVVWLGEYTRFENAETLRDEPNY